jgi:hypothetical protein
MRKRDMRVGQQYAMQRGPTRRSVLVTLLAKDAPSELGDWVLVRIDERIGKGNEREAPSRSIYPLAGSEPVKLPKKRPEPDPVREAPPGWMPSKGSSVTWAQTQEIPMRVVEVDLERSVAVIEGTIFGMQESFEAVIAELCPRAHGLEVVRQEDVDRRVGERLPEELEGSFEPHPSKPKALHPEPADEAEDIVERLVFSPQLVAFYRRNFAKRASPAVAEQRLRKELEGARKARKRVRGKKHRPYLTLEVPGRFEIPLWKRPLQEDVDSCYVKGITLLRESKRRAA